MKHRNWPCGLLSSLYHWMSYVFEVMYTENNQRIGESFGFHVLYNISPGIECSVRDRFGRIRCIDEKYMKLPHHLSSGVKPACGGGVQCQQRLTVYKCVV